MADHFFDVEIDERGNMVWNATDRRTFMLHKLSLAGKHCQVMLRKKPQKRTIDQNSYIHAEFFPKMAAYTEHDVPEVKLLMLGECFGYQWFPSVGRYVPREGSTSNLSKRRMSEFIEWALVWIPTFTDGKVIALTPDEWYQQQRLGSVS